mmetsp:Transcript_45424/g.97019  ORF Transcript_45424/g.97019 Transcript_45424/m.97019 type:complete len:520 (-) Transcript_45424:349-1908(-)
MSSLSAAAGSAPSMSWGEGYHSGHWVYFVFLAVANCLQLASFVALTVYFIRGYLHSRRDEGNVVSGTVAIVVPCFMPNEHPIIAETLEHILNKLEFEQEVNPEASQVTVYCAYNAPDGWTHPIEDKLKEMDGKRHGKWSRSFRSVRVPDSKSKASNLNYLIPEINADYTVIYDADHHPDPRSLSIAVAKLEREGVDCIQGSTYIRKGLNCMGKLIDAEFFVTHFVIFPSLQVLSGTGFFGGSNAVWRSKFLKSQAFHHSAQTEDIEYTTRALLSGAKIQFCPESRSGELAPVNVQAFWKQRLRWAMGWDQVTLMHFDNIRKGENISCLARMGIMYLLPLRWVILMFMLVSTVVQPIVLAVYDVHNFFLDGGERLQMTGPIQTTMYIGLAVLIGTVSVALASVIAYERRDNRFLRQLSMVIIFLVIAPGYLVLQLMLVCVSLHRIRNNKVGDWVVTQRTAATSEDTDASAKPAAEAVGKACREVAEDECTPSAISDKPVASSSESETPPESRAPSEIFSV